MTCPRCNAPMENLGNLSGCIMASYPPQWDETWACHECKVRKVERVHGTLPPKPPDVSEYEMVTSEGD